MPDDDLTPEEEQVRRMLADARHDEPMPADVATRLDEVLTGLRDEDRDEPARTWPSTADLAAARRRRRVRGWLVAAAAVVVVGVGFNQVDWSGVGSSGGDSDSGASSVVAGDAPNAEEAPSAASGARDSVPWRRALAQLNADRFGRQVEKLRSVPQATTTSDGYQSYDLDGGLSAYAAACSVGRPGPGTVIPVRYDGERAWLVFRTPKGDSQVVDLYLCGNDAPTRSITLPVP